ncbi:hypothetical protein Sjap_017686 [Stephania japonica]|uniref:Small auxin up regulated protein n=1 Tax=Stephania japonica TaxID=461633 RepID=A0AAP0I6L5_9MAGN
MKNNGSSNVSRVLKKIWCCGSKSFPTDLPKGHIRVYVGNDTDQALYKFELEAKYLNHPIVEDLLQLSVEEFGYSYNGGLRIACEVELFRYLIELLKSQNPLAHCLGLQDLISMFYKSNSGSS